MGGPKYEPEKWNDCPEPLPLEPPEAHIPSSYCGHRWHKQRHNNCYNYACDIQNNTFAQPNGHYFTEQELLSCGETTKAALEDGLTKIDSVDNCPSNCHKVALVICPGEDYHWYRQDEDGKWSHKPASGLATNGDVKGNKILNPETSGRGPYTIFCGYFCVCKNKVVIRGLD